MQITVLKISAFLFYSVICRSIYGSYIRLFCLFVYLFFLRSRSNVVIENVSMKLLYATLYGTAVDDVDESEIQTKIQWDFS